MLDQVIAARSGRQRPSYGQRVGLILQRVSRIVAVPALLLMLGGLLLFAITHAEAASLEPGWLLADAALAPGAFFSRQVFSATGMMSAGLLALAFVPLVTVLLIVGDTVRTRRWQETTVALAVAGILLLSIFLGRR
jgi:hypothetical protein